MLDTLCNSTTTANTVTSNDPIGLGGFDANLFNVFGQTASAAMGGPMWGPGGNMPTFTPFGGNQMGIGLGLAPNGSNHMDGIIGNGTLSDSVVGSPGDGADYMLWDALVQQIRGGMA